MAQIVFAEIGAAVGQTVLPEGLKVLGQQITGAAIGRTVGSWAGRALDNALAGPAEGPRIDALHVMESREGAGVPSVYGKMRVAGQVIWAARFKEHAKTSSAGGKGGPRVTEHSYSVSFAVALGEGPVQSVRRAWANGEAFDLSGVNWRFYSGDETQAPDPLIEIIEGVGQTPAYRGTAYIVFEDLPLAAFGNRLPQLSFEIARMPPGEDEPGLSDVVTAVNIIPASGEFVYATQIIREQIAPGVERALNAWSGEARADFLVALDQLDADLPKCKSVALTVGWFGTDLLAGNCEIRPGVETRERVCVPYHWSVAGETRGSAYLISHTNDSPNYGGTPADQSVVEALVEMKARGLALTLTPFLFMDTDGFPWRGRISVSADGTAAARSEINQFVNGVNGYRRFVLHQAQLAADAGGVAAFLIGSEMVGLTRVRDETGAFPFVEALIALAAEVRAILPGADISYAADWTEYGAYAPGDGSNDVLFPLDRLWADPNVDFVGIDWYPPLGDWRAGGDHLDAQAGYTRADDPAYLASQIAGGEAYDWYYADQTARDAQIRTPINDTAHGEHWVFRAKDITGWATNTHHARPGGVRASAPTQWVPGSKPIRLSEIGFAAVDKGGNAPNLFFDPKSSESAFPPYSSGARDDIFQRRALVATLTHFESDPLVDAAHVWAFDARPFPAWPLREAVWSDGGNWSRGHWLNGRAGLASLAGTVADICARGGVEAVDTSALDGLVDGFRLDGVHTVRAALEPLRTAYGFDCVERDGGLVFGMQGEGAARNVPNGAFIETGVQRTRQLLDKSPQRLRLTHINLEADFQPGLAEARAADGDMRLVMDVSLPVVLAGARAEQIATRLLGLATQSDIASMELPVSYLDLEPGDGLQIDGGPVWRIADVADQNAVRSFVLRQEVAPPHRVRAADLGAVPPPAPVSAAPDLLVIDAAARTPDTNVPGPWVAAFAEPWPGEVVVSAGVAADARVERVRLTRRAVLGYLTAPLGPGPVGRWDRASRIEVHAPFGSFASVPEEHVLAGGNLAALETDQGWEILQFRDAELVGTDQWVLSALLRAQRGSSIGSAAVGARCVVLDEAVRQAPVSGEEIGQDLVWQAGQADPIGALPFEDRAGLPWSVGHLRIRDGQLSWTRRGADVPESWALPEADNTGRFAVAFDMGAGFGLPIHVDAAWADLPAGAIGARVAEIGSDGRYGAWVSIATGSS